MTHAAPPPPSPPPPSPLPWPPPRPSVAILAATSAAAASAAAQATAALSQFNDEERCGGGASCLKKSRRLLYDGALRRRVVGAHFYLSVVEMAERDDR